MSTSETMPESIRAGMLFCERYRIERRLDDGGMATIYLARDESQDELVAIKVLFDRYSDNEVVRARFLDEGRIQAMLDHPNIVHVHRIITDPLLCFVMEYVDGNTLEEYLQENAPLDEAEIVDLMMPVMSAIGFAHNKGIVHRDLKPSNVLLDKGGAYLEPKVMDFGVAKISRGKELTIDGTTVGTLHYMSPEQIVGSSDIDGRADIYSLGCSLYKLCTGEVPFNASSEFALMMAHVEAEPTPPSELRSDLSSRMEEIILRALEKKPDRRFQTIKEMTAELIELADSGDEERITITRPIPGHILKFAMDADEVANDKTQEMRLEYLIGGAGEDRDTAESDVISQTHELSAAALRRIHEDRLKAKRRHTSDTRSMSKVETIERDRPSRRADEEAQTRERPRGGTSQADTMENNLDQLTTRPSTQAGDADDAATTERDPVLFDDSHRQRPAPEELKTIRMHRVEKSEDDDREDADTATDRISDIDGPHTGKTHIFERPPQDVDSQEVTEVVSRGALDPRWRRDDLSGSDPLVVDTTEQTVEHPLPSILQGGEAKTIKESSIATKEAPHVEAGLHERSSPTAGRPGSRSRSDAGDDAETDTMEERPSGKFTSAEDTSDRTLEERPSAKFPVIGEDTSDPTLAERPSGKNLPETQDTSDRTLDERPSRKLLHAEDTSDRTLNERPSGKLPSLGGKSPQTVEERSAVKLPPSPARASDSGPHLRGGSAGDAPSESPSNGGRGAPMEPFEEKHRQSTQNTAVEQSSTNVIWAIIGVVALLFAIAVLVVVVFFI